VPRLLNSREVLEAVLAHARQQPVGHPGI
jgi:hypothetical protein